MRIIGKSWDHKSGTSVFYAQIRPKEYLDIVGEDFGQFEIQRKRENHKAYGRLKQDITDGALLPPITLALKPQFVAEARKIIDDSDRLSAFLSQNNRFNILDGLQRTYILKDISDEGVEFKEKQELLLEIWLEGDLDKLIYRIIVLNAGQKPMSVRHQVELLFSSLQKPIEDKVGEIELVKEKDLRRRRRAGIFSFEVIVSGYQAFVSGSTELNKDNLISQQLQVDSSLDQDEEYINLQFDDFVEYLKFYKELDKEVFRVYPDLNQEREGQEERSTTVAQHWMTNENTCISFFASIAQFAPYDGTSISEIKRKRIAAGLSKLVEKLRETEVGADPLDLEAFEAIRRGKNARKVNIGTYTRRLLANGFKEFYREEGEIPLLNAWNLAVD
ncbi:hypothetical protein [uncultured Thalassospira sp.]|uniref:hypothetical protein n=1 Tax=uncultured Thalassospira sp. TaxID=404382 RepID=UPI0030D9773E|tara:strand:- start:2625 stop:3788 length:1164 start_codon:yes stop_codon:yes gene_type:complete